MFCYVNYYNFGLRYSSGSGDLRLVEHVRIDDPKSNLWFGEDNDFDLRIIYFSVLSRYKAEDKWFRR